MKRNSIITLVVLAGASVLLVTFLTAANSTNNPDTTAKQEAKSSVRGVVVFGTLDVEDGLLPLFPESFPQPTKVVEVLVREGDVVAAGAPLVRFDSELADLKVREAIEALNQAKGLQSAAEALLMNAKQIRDNQPAGFEAQQLAIDSKRKELRAAEIKLEEAENKLRGLNVKNDPELRAARASLESKLKDVEFEEKKLAILKSVSPLPNINAAQAKVDEAEAAVRRHEVLLKQAQFGQKMMTLSAPSSGKVLRNACQKGLTFGPQSRQPAILFQPSGKTVVRCEVDQEWASRVQKDQQAVINDETYSKLTWKGRVLKVSDSILPKRSMSGLPEGFPTSDSRVLEVLVELEKDQNTSGPRFGQRVKVIIDMPE